MQHSLQLTRPVNWAPNPQFQDWYEHTSLLADSISVKHDALKLHLFLLWDDKQFRKFAKATTEGDSPDTLQKDIMQIREQCHAHVDLSMAVFKWKHAQPGTKTATKFTWNLRNLLHNVSSIPSHTHKTRQWRIPSSLALPMTSCTK